MEASADPVRVLPKRLPESRNAQKDVFWKQFKQRVSQQEPSAVTSLHFCPAAPHDFAVTTSTRVSIHDGTTCEAKRNIFKFTDVAYSGSFRSDGQLLVAGGETGVIQAFDLKTRTLLRRLKGHSRAVHWVRYSEFDKLHVLSGSDDNSVRWWDVATEDAILKFEEHADYVRCGSFSPTNHDIWATGSYDHTVRIWDTRAAKSLSVLQHGTPVEDVLFFPSGGMLATAGGTSVKIWDVVGGGRLLHVLGNHKKTVTKLAYASAEDAPRLLTACLDGHLKIYDVNEFKSSQSVKFPGPILSMDISPASSTIAVGTSSGLLSVRQKKHKDQASDVTAKRLQASNYRYYIRGRTELPSDEDYVLSQNKKKNVVEHNKLLLKFRYKDAVVAGLKTMNPTIILALMEEMLARKALLGILRRLDQNELEMLLTFLSKYITLPPYSRFLIPLTSKVLEICGARLGASQFIKKKVMELHDKVQEEMQLQISLQAFQGMLQTIIHASLS